MAEMVSCAAIGIQQHQFAPAKYEPLHQFVRGQLADVRRVMWDVRSLNCPPIVAAMAVIVGGIIEQDINTVTGKSYSYVSPGTETEPESQAYSWHREPPEYIGKIAILSLSNKSELSARLHRAHSQEIKCRVFCEPGLLNYFPVELEHKTTPPLIDGAKRIVAAFGTRV